MKNALITGFHRSGTTLICHLLNKLSNVVALDEPMNISVFRMASPSDVQKTIDQFFSTQRLLISQNRIATSKSQAGRVPSNQLGDFYENQGRESVIDGQWINIDNVNGPDFDIFIKHPAVFTALLPILEDLYPCYISVRNPLAILLSWRATPFPVSKGRAPAAEMIDNELGSRLELESDILERQLILIDFFFARYFNCHKAKILRYEDLISSGGRALSVLDLRAESLAEPLKSRNSLHIKRDRDTREIAKRLLQSDNSCWHFYTHDEVTALAEDQANN
jgi:hypothetical protein